MKRILLFLALVFTMSTAFNLYSQESGSAKIVGHVTDSVTGETLPGANIAIVGTSLGVSTNIDGEYTISNIKPGNYTLKVSYIGYKGIEALSVHLNPGAALELNVQLSPESILTEVVIVTAQVRGQRAAINQQRSSNTVTNIVSSDKIRELPDRNAAESIGRLPGVALQRSGGEGNRVVVRGLSPRFTIVQIDGVRLSGVDDDRGVGMSSISSELLDGIELTKSLTADKDADAIGGIVNLRTRVADKGFHVDFTATGGYNSLDNAYKNYKLSGIISDRFFNDKFGVLVTLGKEQVTRSSDQFDAVYNPVPASDQDPKPEFWMVNETLNESKLLRNRQNGGIVLDFKNDFMKIKFNNTLSQLKDDQLERRNFYDFSSVGYYNANLIKNLPEEREQTNAVNSEFKILNTFLNFDISYSKSSLDRSSDDYYFRNMDIFGVTNKDKKDSSLRPWDLVNRYFLEQNIIDHSILYSDDRQELSREDVTKRIALDWKVPYSLFDNLVSGNVKIGGKYAKKVRSSDTQETRTSYDEGGIGHEIRDRVYDDYFPGFQRGEDFGIQGNYGLAAKNFEDPNYEPHSMLNGKHGFQTAWSADYDFCKYVLDSIYRDYNSRGELEKAAPVQGVGSNARDYHNYEELWAAYVMTTINIGKKIMVIPGVRFEDEHTSYSGFYVHSNGFDYKTGLAVGYPKAITTKRHNTNWFPSVNVKYELNDWMSIRGSYYKSASRPDYNLLSPAMVANDPLTIITMYNPYLNVALAHNFDLGVSFYSNKLGLLSINAFYKRINGYVYRMPSFLTDYFTYIKGAPESIMKALQLPQSLYDQSLFNKGESVDGGIPVNLDDPAYIEGIEMDWQTNFWFLPGLLKGIVLDLNGSVIWSQAKLPYFTNVNVPDPTVPVTHVRKYGQYNIRNSRLIDQPELMFNARLGYDYKGFSSRISFRYQDQTVQSIDAVNNVMDRIGGAQYFLDFTMKMKIYKGLSAQFDWNNITNYIDENFVNHGNYPGHAEYYGSTIQLGLRYQY
jgi:TonB-dependent receptor